MKKASKVFFGLGVAATLGAATIAYVAGKEHKDTPEDLMGDGKELLRDTKDAIEDEVEATINKETKDEKNARHLVKNIQRKTKDAGEVMKKGIDEVTKEVHTTTEKIAKKIKKDA